MSEKKIKNEIVKPERPGGFIDYLPTEYLAREKMLRIIEKVFRSFGFDSIETPRVEFLKTLAGEQSDTGKNIFIIKSGDDKERLALPFDHTVPFARLLAANPYDSKKRTGIRLPWRRMVVVPVFRGEKPQSGRFRQFYQFDVDIAGSDSMMADAEVISIIYKTFKALGLDNFLIKVNNRKILNGLASIAGIQDRAKVKAEDITKEMMRILDKIDKIGIEAIEKELRKEPDSEYDESPNLSDVAINKIRTYLKIKGDNLSKLKECEKVFSDTKIAIEGISELRQIVKFLDTMGVPDKYISIDFSIARGLDYYTGPVMETVLLDAPEFGSVFGGGRYNNLVARFTGEELPAVGVSLGIDRLFAALDYLELIDKSRTTAVEVMVLRLSEKNDKEYLRIAEEIRSTDLNTEISLFSDTTFKGQFNFAIGRGVKYVVIYGDDEVKKGTISIKNLETRKQEEIKREKIINWFSEK